MAREFLALGCAMAVGGRTQAAVGKAVAALDSAQPSRVGDRTMSLSGFFESFRATPRFGANVAVWERVPARLAVWAPPPAGLRADLVVALNARGYERLYSHQAAAVEAALRGENLVLTTGTSSGKTLGYNLPVLNQLLAEPGSTALYLFPTKALAQDQAAELARWESALGAGSLGARMYDGDTPPDRRAEARREARLLLSNPDMLHAGILPHHTRWADFLGQLRYVVLDEMHVFRGVFGSHMANVLRRLRRVCAFYGAAPQFLCTSATIANPRELAERLLEAPVTVIAEDGSPAAEKHVVLYNPPLVDSALNIRRSSLQESCDIALALLRAGAQTAVFGRTRRTVELVLGFLRERLAAEGIDPHSVRGYRAGYLPEERREIEAGLRSGAVRCVASTSALELGVDIGTLEAVVMAGYPGTVASFRQQAGRAGRREESSLAVMVASGDPLDQFLVMHPEFLLDRSPEHARINPENLALLASHLRCAAFELPFAPGERFGTLDVDSLLEALAEGGDLHRSRTGEFGWVGEEYPAAAIGLRTAGMDRVILEDVSGGRTRMIGEMERSMAPNWAHPGAVYLHEGRVYEVESLDLEAGVAKARPSDADYLTEPSQQVDIRVADVRDAVEGGPACRAWGELEITAKTVSFRKVRRATAETIGHAELDLPERVFSTAGCWLWVAPGAAETFEAEVRALIGPNDYGPSWAGARKAARKRDGFACARCGAPEPSGREHDVHHKIPFRSFGYIAGQNDRHELANTQDNLITLCAACHRRLEAQQGTRTALGGLAYALHNLAPLFLLCDKRDLWVEVEMKGKETGTPTITFFDEAEEGVGLSEELFERLPEVLRAAADLIGVCPCSTGCPACVGPVAPGAGAVKETAGKLAALLAESKDN